MSVKPLGSLKKGETGTIISSPEDDQNSNWRRLREMGLIVGSSVEVLHEAPFGGDPIAVRVRGTLIALHRKEANSFGIKLST